MGKPYTGEEWEQLWEHSLKKKEEQKETPAPGKFTKAFQAYLDALAKDVRKTAEEKQPAKSS